MAKDMIYITANILNKCNSRGEHYTVINCVGDDAREYHTYIVDGYKNERLWESILSNPSATFAFKHTRLKKGKIRQLDADVRPTMVTQLDKDELGTLLGTIIPSQ